MSEPHIVYAKDLISEPGATGVLSEYKDHTDPKYVGPGTWNVAHRQAYRARTRKQQLEFIVFMKEICTGFPCHICRGHCTEYIKNHPMEEYVGMLVEVNGQRVALGLFVWTWKFHNAVNARIGKPIMAWETAYNLYSDKENLVCSKNCLDAADSAIGQTPPIAIPTSKPSTVITKIPESKIVVPSPNTSNPKFRLVSVNRK